MALLCFVFGVVVGVYGHKLYLKQKEIRDNLPPGE